MIKSFKKAFYKNGYLFITAAWLYTLAFIITNYWVYNSSPQKVQQNLEKHIARQESYFNRVLDDTATLYSITRYARLQGNSTLRNLPIGLFSYQVNDRSHNLPLYWNTTSMQVLPEDLLKPDGTYSVTYYNGIFELIKKTVQIDNRDYIIAGLVPVYWQYFQENKYLVNHFDGFPHLGNRYEISNSGYPVKDAAGNTLLHFREKNSKDINFRPDAISVTLRILSVIFFLVFLNNMVRVFNERKGFFKGLSLLIFIILALRLLSYYFPFPFNFRAFELFDPGIYASSSINPSLGDLLINVSLFSWLLGYIKSYHHEYETPAFLRKIYPYRHVFVTGSIVLLTLFTFEATHIIDSLITDSKISFNVINFFELNAYTVVGFGIMCFIEIAFYQLSYLLMRPAQLAGYPLMRRIIIILATGVAYIALFSKADSILEDICVTIWLCLISFLIQKQWKDFSKPLLKTSLFLFWVTLFSISMAAIIIHQNSNLELKERKRVAEKLAMSTDEAGETLLRIAMSNFTAFFFQNNFSRFYNNTANRWIKDSLVQENFSGYLNKYDTRIFIFDSLARPLYNDDSTSFQVLRTIITTQAHHTDIPDLYYNENDNDRFSFIFMKRIPKRDSVHTAGYFCAIVKPQRYAGNALSLELFDATKNLPGDINNDYAYAIYKNGKLISNFNDYSFSETIPKSKVPLTDFKEISTSQSNELWYNAGNHKVIVVVKRNAQFVESLTLFAYIFCTSVLIIAIIYAGNFVFKARFRWKAIKPAFRLNIHEQIQGTIIFISLFSFLVIGASTISFFIMRFDKSNREKLSKTVRILAKETETSMQNELFFNVPDSNFFLENDNNEIERKVLQIADVNNIDVNYYELDGRLKASTQPSIYNKEILSPVMDPLAYYNMRFNHRLEYMQKELIGNFSYLSIYIPLHDTNGTTIAYLNIPYLNAQNELKQEISSFLVTIINLNALIFLLAGAIAIQLTRRITSSFSLIAQRMRAINLGQENKPIDYDRQDEIGVLVREYNIMVKKLNESAKALARSEREGAWKEMARQVAHEIKNPLTPMKLSIQYLERAVKNNDQNTKELTESVSQTLIEQIDQLAKIAGDFSQFANISNTKTEHFNLNDILHSITNLYSTDPRLEMELEIENKNGLIAGDKIQINRLFTNLIKNAIEASSETPTPIPIKIRQFIRNGMVVVAITDKGNGIPEDMHHKIFVPNFTTKSSGTGLGLAICKGICENAGGNIYFESEMGKGTTFYVEFPQIKRS